MRFVRISSGFFRDFCCIYGIVLKWDAFLLYGFFVFIHGSGSGLKLLFLIIFYWSFFVWGLCWVSWHILSFDRTILLWNWSSQFAFLPHLKQNPIPLIHKINFYQKKNTFFSLINVSKFFQFSWISPKNNGFVLCYTVYLDNGLLLYPCQPSG